MRSIFSILALLSCLGLLSQTITLSDSDIAAFYGAEGHGRSTTGGRGQNIYQVTNLNDSGSGSLRNALDLAEANGGGIIIFRVGGTINLSSDIFTNGSNITIAGETAPGDGIAIYGGEYEINSAENIIMRHIRIRVGDPKAAVNTTDGLRFRMDGTTTGNWSGYMIDHVSLSWSQDELLAVESRNDGMENFTISNSIIAEPFETNYGGLLWGGPTSANQTYNFSYIKNFFARVEARVMRSSGADARFEFINNYVFNYDEAVYPTTENYFDVIGNVFETGQGVEPFSTIRLEPCTSNCDPDITDISTTRGHWTDNTKDGGAISVTDAVTGTLVNEGTPGVSSGYTAMANALVKSHVLNNAGARATMEGLDQLDASYVANATDQTGWATYPNAEADTGGLPTLSSGTAYADSDGDGLSDEFETVNGGSISPSTRPATATLVDGTIIDQSGVTNYATTGYTYMDIFLGELAGDWGSAPQGGGGGGGSSTPDGVKNGTSGMLISH